MRYTPILRSLILVLVYSLSVATSRAQWAYIASMPATKEMHATAVLDGYLYIIGGSGPSNTCYRYNIATNTWSSIANLPTAVSYPSAAGYNSKLYVTGGYAGCCGGTETAALQIYDPATNTWSAGAAMPATRAAHGSATLGGRIYVVGGSIGATLYNTLFCYDPVANTWATLASMPTARYQVTAEAANGKLYATGGYNATWLTAHEEYDPVANTWAVRAAMPTGRYLQAGGAYQDGGSDKVFICGGYSGGWQNTCRSYDPLTNTWSALANMLVVRGRVSGAASGACIYMAGGTNGTSATATAESVCPGTILPLDVLFFDGYRRGEEIQLSWVIADANAGAELQRSYDGVHFETLLRNEPAQAAVPATGFVDSEAPASGADAAYYRLSLSHPDGSTGFSEVLAFDLSASGFSMNLYPNPVRSRITCDIQAHDTHQLKVTILDALGRIHRSAELLTVEGFNSFNLDVDDLAQGVYFLRITSESGQQMKKFVKE